MFRTITCCATILLVLIVTVQADWTVPEQVNETEYEYGLAACRDSDTPWGIAADTAGNIHFVIETEGEGNPNQQSLEIHYRVKRANGIWTDELQVTADEPLRTDPNYFNHNDFGHPSGMCFYRLQAGFGESCPAIYRRLFRRQTSDHDQIKNH